MAEEAKAAATPAATPAATKPAATPAAAPAPKELISPAMKELFAAIVEQQKRLGWTDAKLCEFATATLGPADPYKKLKITTIEFLRRLRVGRMQLLLTALRAAR